MTAFPNVFHNDKWSVAFSNLPTVGDMSDMKYYDNYVKSLTIPDQSMGEIISEFRGFSVRHPMIPKANVNLSPLSIDFKLSEDILNYLNLFEWMQELKYGDIDPNHDDFMRRYYIKSINLNIMDNEKRSIAILRFKRAFLLGLSAISLETGSSEEVTFNCTFSYEELTYETKSVLNC